MTKKRFVLHIDMNSYFASVEQQANPFLRGKPLGVCAYLSDHGTIIASSIEAKRYGVRTAMRVQDAKQLCPQLVLVENEPAKYRFVTKQIFSIFADYAETIEPYSIDEAFIDLTGHVRSFDEGIIVIQEIKKRIRSEVGEWLRCSAGFSYTKWLAKFASDMAEKGGYNIITKQNLVEKLAKADLTDAWGINLRIEARLQRIGIRNLIDLKNKEPHMLIKHLGAYGYSLWADVNGVEITKVKSKKELPVKSVGHSYQVPREAGRPEKFAKLLMKMCEKTGRRMRGKGFKATHISLALGFRKRGRFYKTHKLSYPLYDTMSIYRAAVELLGTEVPYDSVSFIAVSVSGLQKEERQNDLFDITGREVRLTQALDSINDTFGEYTVMQGSMQGMEAHGRDRVGFRKTVDAKFEDSDSLSYHTDDDY